MSEATRSASTQRPAPGAGEWPRWLAEIHQLVSVCPQFVVSGNVRDTVLVPRDGGVVEPTAAAGLLSALDSRGIRFLLVFNPVTGYKRVARDGQLDTRQAFQDLGIAAPPSAGTTEVEAATLLQHLYGAIVAVSAAGRTPCGLVIDHASHLTGHGRGLSPAAQLLLQRCELLAEDSGEIRGVGDGRVARRNPIIWLIRQPTDLPGWFGQGSPRIRRLVAELPNRRTRAAFAPYIRDDFADGKLAPALVLDRFVQTLADLTDGLPLKGIRAIGDLAMDRELCLADVEEAVSAYKAGISDNPWRDPELDRKIKAARQDFAKRVIGQDLAITRVVDVLMRSVTGLSGAHTATRGGRPRGVLFFAGPTGVGKTELAKAITQQLFGDERAYQRFDMSEFAAEHSEARLIGAPPGYVGHDSGGELVNAVRQRPFSLFLFDEIEKAHDRILDKFLQILEDGRLTDGRGETVFFSDAIIVFTSNLGINVEEGEEQQIDETGRILRRPVRRRNVSPDDKPAEMEQKLLNAVRDHFRVKLGRPELLNRIGDNVIVFRFIDRESGQRILEKMLANVQRRVKEEHALELEISSAARSMLANICLASLDDGGRGIGNLVETAFINPLARALFEAGIGASRARVVKEIRPLRSGGFEAVLA